MNRDWVKRYLGVVCVVGAAIEFYYAIALVTPDLWALTMGIDSFEPDLRWRVDMGISASLAFGWGVLFLWTARNPIARRGVLAIS
ncbi:hypothetical protein ACFL6C_07120 [Myxococcota bacterium]